MSTTVGFLTSMAATLDFSTFETTSFFTKRKLTHFSWCQKNYCSKGWHQQEIIKVIAHWQLLPIPFLGFKFMVEPDPDTG